MKPIVECELCDGPDCPRANKFLKKTATFTGCPFCVKPFTDLLPELEMFVDQTLNSNDYCAASPSGAFLDAARTF